MSSNQGNPSNVPLAQWAYEEVQEAIQGTNAHLYPEELQENQAIPALERMGLLALIANMQQQMTKIQKQLQQQQENIVEILQHQQEVDLQASQLLMALQQNPQVQPPLAGQPQQTAIVPVQPLVVPQQQIVHAVPRIDVAKPPAAFCGTSSKGIESWIMAMGLYFAANEAMSDNQKAVRMALNLAGTAQRWFHNAIDVPLQHLTLTAMEAKLLATFMIPNRDQMTRRQLRNLRQLTSVDAYAQIFRSTYYMCLDVSPAKANARFIKGLKTNTHLQVEERTPDTSDAAILLAQAFDMTRFGQRSGQQPRQGGRTAGRFGNNNRGRDRYHRCSQYGSNNRRQGDNHDGQGRNNRGRNGGRYGNGCPPPSSCYRCGQLGYLANRCTAQLTPEAPKN